MSHGICLPCLYEEFGLTIAVKAAAEVPANRGPWDYWQDEGGEG